METRETKHKLTFTLCCTNYKDMGNYYSLSNLRQMKRGLCDNMLAEEIYIIIFHARYRKDMMSDTFDSTVCVEKIFVSCVERFELDV